MQNIQKAWDVIIREKFRIITIALMACVAWACMQFFTPYKAPVQTQFYVAEQEGAQKQMRAEVLEVKGKDMLKVRIQDGARQGQEVYVNTYETKTAREGTTVLIYGDDDFTKDDPGSAQVWRVPALIFLVALMAVLTVIIGGSQGLLSLVALGSSIAVVIGYVIPRVIDGHDAILVSTIGAFTIATLTLLVGHKLRWRTAVSLLSLYIALAGAVLFAVWSGWFAQLTGIYDETSNMLRLSGGEIDMYGVLIGGMVIAALGVLDDVVTTQVAAIDELHQAKPKATFKEMFARGMSIGREHLSALINTLALAYVGVALPSLLLRIVTQSDGFSGFLLTVNYEFLAAEVVRTVVASVAVIIAIPISTFVAVACIKNRKQLKSKLARVMKRKRVAKK